MEEVHQCLRLIQHGTIQLLTTGYNRITKVPMSVQEIELNDDPKNLFFMVQDALQSGRLSDACSLIQRLVLQADDSDKIAEFSLLCCKMLLAAGDEKQAATIVRLSSDALARKGAFERLFDYWTELGGLEAECLNNGILALEKGVLESLVGQETSLSFEVIDTEKKFKSNIDWLCKYNIRFVEDLIGHNIANFTVDQLSEHIGVAIRLGNSIFFRSKVHWTSEVLTAQNTNRLDPLHLYVFFIPDIRTMLSVINTHNTLVTYPVIKRDRYIVIPRLQAYCISQLLSLSDLDKGNYLFHFLLEENWRDRLLELVKRGMLAPTHYEGPSHLGDEITGYCKRLTEDNSELTVDIANKLRIRYPMDHYYRLRRDYFHGDSGVRTMLLTSRHSTYVQHSSKHLAQGFKQIKCPALVLKEKRDQGVGYTYCRLMRIIQRWKPDLMMSINNFRKPLERYAMPGIPFATWVQDDPKHLAKCETLSGNDFVFAAAKDIIRELPLVNKILGGKEIHMLPVPFDPETFYPLPQSPKKYNASYVAHLDITPEMVSYYSPEKRVGTPFELVIHGLLHRMESMDRFEIQALLTNEYIAKAFLCQVVSDCRLEFPNDHVRLRLLRMLTRVGLFLLRVQPVKYLIDHGIKDVVVGGRGWSEIEFFRPYSLGAIAHGPELNQIYNETRINLHLAPKDSFHPKVGEVLGGGGFMITPWKGHYDGAPLTDHFIEDEELVLVKDNEELLAKIRYYLAHPEERMRIAQRGRERVLAEFTVAHAARKILDVVFG